MRICTHKVLLVYSELENSHLDIMESRDHNHWHSSNYAVKHVRNRNSNIQGRSPNVVKVIFHKELLLKEEGANSFL